MNKKPGKNKARDLGFYALLLVILIAMIFSFNKNDTEVGVIGYSELRDHFLNEEVVSFVAEGNVACIAEIFADPFVSRIN